nr:hypothetical protein [Tanacetum cinerariifolium]
MSSKDAKEECIESDLDKEANLTGPKRESSKKKKLKKFDFVTEGGDHVYLTKERIKEQKRIKESIKANLVKQEVEIGKEELVDLLGIDVVKGFYKAKLQYDKYCDKMLNRKLARKNRKHVDDVHDYFMSTEKFKSSVKYKDHLARTVLNEPSMGMILFNSVQRQDFATLEDLKDFNKGMLYILQEIFFRLHQGPGIDDHARTFTSFLLAEVSKRNLNPLKQMRAIKQLRK